MPWMLLLAPLLGCAGDPVEPQAPREPVPVEWGGWVTPWDIDRGLSRVGGTPEALDDVFVFAGQLTEEGVPFLAPRHRDYAAIMDRLAGHGARTWLTVVNDVATADGSRVRLKDPDVVHALLSNPRRRRRHVQDLRGLAQRIGVHGLDIDYENLSADDRAAFSLFVEELTAALHEVGLRLSVTVQPKTEDRHSAGPGVADWSRLCASVDRLQVMLYNLHGGHSAPGPVATSSWIRQVLTYGRGQCEAGRLVPVLKTSGFAWGPEGVESLHMGRATSMARTHGATIQRDPDGAAPFFTFRDTQGVHTIYFEDAESLMAKVEVLFELGANRIVFWSLGREDSDLLPRLVPIQTLPR